MGHGLFNQRNKVAKRAVGVDVGDKWGEGRLDKI